MGEPEQFTETQKIHMQECYVRAHNMEDGLVRPIMEHEIYIPPIPPRPVPKVAQFEIDDDIEERSCFESMARFFLCCRNKNSAARRSRQRILKQANFISTPIYNKPVHNLPGIEKAISDELANRDIVYAHQLLECYLEMEGKRDFFVNWMMVASSISMVDALRCYYALQDYDEQFVRVPSVHNVFA